MSLHPIPWSQEEIQKLYAHVQEDRARTKARVEAMEIQNAAPRISREEMSNLANYYEAVTNDR